MPTACDRHLPALIHFYLDAYPTLTPHQVRRIIIEDEDLDLHIDSAQQRYRVRLARLSAISRALRKLVRQGIATYELGEDQMPRYRLRQRDAERALERLLSACTPASEHGGGALEPEREQVVP